MADDRFSFSQFLRRAQKIVTALALSRSFLKNDGNRSHYAPISKKKAPVPAIGTGALNVYEYYEPRL
jgi:stage V sporulation protein SpoVS